MTDPICEVCGTDIASGQRADGHLGCLYPDLAALHTPGEVHRRFYADPYGDRVIATVWVWDARFAWWRCWTEGTTYVPDGNQLRWWWEHTGWSSTCFDPLRYLPGRDPETVARVHDQKCILVKTSTEDGQYFADRDTATARVLARLAARRRSRLLEVARIDRRATAVWQELQEAQVRETGVGSRDE